MDETALYLPFNSLHALWFCECNYAELVSLFFDKSKKSQPKLESRQNDFLLIMGRNWHFLNNILSGPPTGSLPNGQIPLWDLIVGN